MATNSTGVRNPDLSVYDPFRPQDTPGMPEWQKGMCLSLKSPRQMGMESRREKIERYEKAYYKYATITCLALGILGFTFTIVYKSFEHFGYIKS